MLTCQTANTRGALWRLTLLLWAALFVWLAPAQAAEPPPLTLENRIYSPKALLPASSVLKDAAGEFTIDDIRRLDAEGAFAPLRRLFGAGYIKDVYWLRLRVTLPHGTDPRWLLQVGPPYLDDIRVHHLRPGGSMAHERRAGDRSTHVGASEHRLATFAVALEPGVHVFYVRVHTASSMILVPRLVPAELAPQEAMRSYLLHGANLGASLTMVVAAVAAGLLLRQRIYLLFALFVGLLTVMWSFTNGLPFQFLPPGLRSLADPLTGFLIAMNSAVGLYFFMRLFDYRHRYHWLYRLSQVISVYFVVVAFAPFVDLYGDVAPYTSALMVLSLLLTLIPLRRWWREGGGVERAGAVAFVVYVLLAVLNLLSVMGLIPPSNWAVRGVQLGSLVQLFALFLAIFVRTQRAEGQLRRAEKAIGRATADHERERLAREQQGHLISMMAHEIRTPVAIIDAALQSLQVLDAQPTPERAQRHERIARALARMNALTELALAQDRLEVADWTQNVAPLNLATLTHDVLGTIGGAAESRVSVQAPDDLCEVQADERMLRYALVNLIDNALKYSPPAAPVSVSIEEMAHDGRPGCRWVVVDQGRGIRAGDHERVFHKYFRAADATELPGLGLGLYLVAQIVARHGGWIRATATPAGAGARFECWLPCAQQEARP